MLLSDQLHTLTPLDPLQVDASFPAAFDTDFPLGGSTVSNRRAIGRYGDSWWLPFVLLAVT